MAINPECVEVISNIRYRLNANNMKRPKDKYKGQVEIVSDHRALSRI